MQNDGKRIAAAISPQSRAFLEEIVAAGKASNLGEAIDVTVERMRHTERREHTAKAEVYSAEPSSEEVAQDRATMRAVRNSNPSLRDDE